MSYSILEHISDVVTDKNEAIAVIRFLMDEWKIKTSVILEG